MAFEQQEVQFQTKKVIGVGEFAVNTKLTLDLEKPLKKVISVSAVAENLSGEQIDTDYNMQGKTAISVLYLTENDELESVFASCDWQNTVKVVGENPEASVTVKEATIAASSMAEISLSILHNCVVEGVVTETISPLAEIADDYVTDMSSVEYNKLASRSASKFTLAETLESASNAKSVLATSASINVTNVTSSIDQVTIEGTCFAKVLYAAEEGTNTLTKQIDFKQEVPCMGANPGDMAEGLLTVLAASCTLQIAEKCTFMLAINVEAHARTYKTENLTLVSDLFSTTKQLDTTTECVEISSFAGTKSFSDNVTLDCSLQGEVGGIVDTVNPSVVVAKQSIENGAIVIEGVVSATCIYTVEGAITGEQISAPFVTKVDTEFKGTITSLTASVNVLSCKVRSNNEVEVIAELNFNASVEEDKYFEFIKSATQTGDRQTLGSAITIYVTKPNEKLFDVARALGVTPETITSQNELVDGKFTSGQRVFVYSPLNAEF